MRGARRFEALERLVLYCRTTSASTAPRTPRRTCCPCAYVLITVLRVNRSCELFPDGFDIHLLQASGATLRGARLFEALYYFFITLKPRVE